MIILVISVYYARCSVSILFGPHYMVQFRLFFCGFSSWQTRSSQLFWPSLVYIWSAWHGGGKSSWWAKCKNGVLICIYLNRVRLFGWLVLLVLEILLFLAWHFLLYNIFINNHLREFTGNSAYISLSFERKELATPFKIFNMFIDKITAKLAAKLACFKIPIYHWE